MISVFPVRPEVSGWVLCDIDRPKIRVIQSGLRKLRSLARTDLQKSATKNIERQNFSYLTEYL